MANAKINIAIREMLLDHSIRLGDTYYRQNPEECLSEYLKCIDDLKINPVNRIQKHVQQLKEDKYKEYLINRRMKKLESENQELIQEKETTKKAADFSEIRERLNEIRKQMKEGKN